MATEAKESLLYDRAMWTSVLDKLKVHKPTQMQKVHLVFSLIQHLQLPLLPLIEWFFTSTNPEVHHKAGIFMGYDTRKIDACRKFAPAVVFKAWHEYWPDARPHLHNMIEPCGREIALKESNAIINDKRLKIRINELTQDVFENTLQPGRLLDIYRDHAPFVWGLLDVFASSPNAYRVRLARELKRREQQESEEGEEGEEDDVDDELDEEHDDDGSFAPNESDDSAGEVGDENIGRFLGENGVPVGFRRNPMFAVLMAISMTTFARNSATNALPMLLGLFFKVEGTSSRGLQMLSNTSMIISSRSAERIKERVSSVAVEKAVALMHSGDLFFSLVDNINLYLRKYEQRINNRNTMIHATNTAVIEIDDEGIDKERVTNLDERLKLRGSRHEATFDDISPNDTDDLELRKGYEHLIAELIVKYAPESRRWKNRNALLDQIQKDMPREEPIPARKTKTFPSGVQDVNEGSKKGCIDLAEAIAARGQFSKEEWSGKTRIISGDWLTSRNFRLARRDRADDKTPFDRLEYLYEHSQLWHFALQATQALIRGHWTNAIEDPASLAAHKGLLGRTWDVNKPNYAAAKSLIRHSLIARILHAVKKVKGLQGWKDLGKWRPEYDEITSTAQEVYEQFATTEAAEKAKEAGDDWNAHNVYFIRDALLFLYFEEAVRWADPPRILRVLRYWCMIFRGCGQHNYARECAEILVAWKYELHDDLRKALARSWFVNRWGLDGHWIPADLYLEHLNLLVKRIFIAKGNGVTIDYIITKGSACVEAFREVSHSMARFFGNPDRRRKSKEASFQEDLRVLVEALDKNDLGGEYKKRLVPVSGKGQKAAKMRAKGVSAITDVFVAGTDIWGDKFEEWKFLTTFDPALGPTGGYHTGSESPDRCVRTLNNGTAFDDTNRLHVTADGVIDLGILAEGEVDGLGGGGEFDTGLGDD